MRPADIGVVLAGGMRSHQENYAAAFAAAGCPLLAVGVADGLPDDEAGRHATLAVAHGIPLLPLADALRLPGAKVASIAVSMPHRAAVATACARAGLALYLDKPLAGSVADAAAIAAAVGDAGVAAQVFSHVSAGWAQQARAAIRSGRLGRLLAVHADMLMAKGSPAAIPAGPRRESATPADFPEDIAKREMTDMGVYPVSLVGWLLEREARTVTAVTANHFFREHLSRDVEDYGAMLIGYEGGIDATITCGRTGWHSAATPYLARVILVGEAGTLVFGTDQVPLLVTSRGGGAEPEPDPDPDPADPMGMWLSTRRPVPATAMRIRTTDPRPPDDVAMFVAALSAGGARGIGVADAVAHCRVLAAAYRSAAEQRQVAV